MKKLYTLLFFAAGLAGSSYAQTDQVWVWNMNDSIGGGACVNQIGVTIGTAVNPETGGVITVDWGDGNTETVNYTAAGNDYEEFPLPHGYSVPGTYFATVTVYSGTSGSNVGTPTTVELLAGDPASCGYAYIWTYQNSPSMQYPDAVYDFTGADGITTTISISPNPMMYNYLYGLNPANAPYLVSINDAWLANNGLAQVSPDFTITSFAPSGMANPSQASMEVTCNVPIANPDFSVSYSYGWNFVAPLQTGSVFIDVCNLACSNTSDATVTLEFPAGLGLVPNTAGLTNASVSGNILTFDVLGLTNCEGVVIPFTFPGTLTAGTQLDFVSAVSHPNDTDASNDEHAFTCFVVNSYDPNNKLVDKPQNIDPAVQEDLQYVINFQNDGNGEAYNVVVTDVIDNNLDLSTFEVLGSKHGVATSVNTTTRVVTFTFSSIMLAPSSQDEEASKGYVVYKIKEIAGLGEGDAIDNTANIYFDFNPAIVTNTTHNVNTTLSLGDIAGETISMYPNPATDAIRFNGAAVQSAKVYDLAGKLILDAAAVYNNELSVAGLSNGVYQVQIATAKGVHTQKLVVKK